MAIMPVLTFEQKEDFYQGVKDVLKTKANDYVEFKKVKSVLTPEQKNNFFKSLVDSNPSTPSNISFQS